MKRVISVFVIVATIFAANAAWAGTSFEWAEIVYHAFWYDGESAWSYVEEEFDEKINTDCVTDLANTTSNCIRYQLSSVQLPDRNGIVWRAGIYAGQLKKNPFYEYDYHNWDVINMKPNCTFPCSNSDRVWTNDFRENEWKDWFDRMYFVEMNSGVEGTRAILVRNGSSEIRISYRETPGSSLNGREFSFQYHLD